VQASPYLRRRKRPLFRASLSVLVNLALMENTTDPSARTKSLLLLSRVARVVKCGDRAEDNASSVLQARQRRAEGLLWSTAADSLACQRELSCWGPGIGQSHECSSGVSSATFQRCDSLWMLCCIGPCP
jgi:hypothetical protein